ncbi:MAG: flagellar hook-associated protein FlgL [Bdellovibrionales bacterium]
MRIADKMQFEQVKANIGKNRTQMAELQNQAATQKRVTKPSDDPLAASRVLSNRIDLQGNRQFTKSLNYAKSFLEYTDQSLNDLSEVLMRAKELAISQSSDSSANDETRRVVATEVEQLYNSLIGIGNRKLGDRFIFGGFRTQQAPFNPQGEYVGDPGEMNIHIDKETFIPMNVPGGRVFLGLGVDPNGMAKPTPVQPRTIEEFEARMKAPATSGPISAPSPGPGLSPSPGPTSGSGPVPTSSSSLSSTPATTPAEIRGPASVSASEAMANASTGPSAMSEEPTGTNLFQALKELEVSLRTNDKAGVQDSLDVLDAALSQVVLTRAQVGSRSMALDQLMQTLEKAKVDNQVSISQLEDADIFSTVSDINKTESTLQATLQTSGKLIERSLMDFLR